VKGLNMYALDPQDYVKKRFIGLWNLLSFQAGFINSLGFLACQRFVSHVTGFSTHVGMSLGDGQYWYALELFTAPLSFIFGSWFSGYLTVARRSHGREPRYDLATLLIPMILFAMMIGGLWGHFGVFGGPHSFKQDGVLLNTLTFLCGIQNACFATFTKGHIRTTHLTGISTDLGTELSLTLHGNLNPEEKFLAIRRNLLRITTFSSFSIGALFSALIAPIMGYSSFLIPFSTSAFVAALFLVRRIKNNNEIQDQKN